MVNFPFTKETIQKGKSEISVLRPEIPVTLITPIGNYPIANALIDSGSDLSVLSREIAEALELDLSGKFSESEGLGGLIKMQTTNVSIKVGETTIRKMPIEVPYDKDVVKTLILGRLPFFNYFKICFDMKKQQISLKPKR